MAADIFEDRWGSTVPLTQSDVTKRYFDWEELFSKSGNSPAIGKQSRLPQASEAKSATSSGQQTMTTAEAKPCATCDKNKNYSLAFLVKDANDKICTGMYYTVKYEHSGELYQGIIDENGLTERYFSGTGEENIYLYIGHRSKEDDYPISQTTEEEKYDEAPLAFSKVELISEKKISDAKTKRLWKPWTFSTEAAKHTIDNWEKRKRYVYDDRFPNKNWDGTHVNGERLTIGAGHLITSNKEAEDYLEKYPTTGPGMTDSEIDDLFKNDVKTKAKIDDANEDINVPLYQNEFDAIIDIRFNAGSGSTDFEGGFSNTDPHNKTNGKSLKDLLNAGRYTQAGNRILTVANSAKKNGVSEWHKGVQNRRNDQKSVFFGE
ncbi:glycoside hydrolase family protein [Rhizobium paknamense]|uniref:Lysozyme n=1 Tax=Rhizobium paknamense TaxID=1206817 RepID=A0ABU0IM07_9HYPH|nr:hypothetical protein [Rhizobium paknamense]MDQ0458229.1 GH24 family phage-related lysozyme (muramidase) [Rhizobium paknamense]